MQQGYQQQPYGQQPQQAAAGNYKNFQKSAASQTQQQANRPAGYQQQQQPMQQSQQGRFQHSAQAQQQQPTQYQNQQPTGPLPPMPDYNQLSDVAKGVISVINMASNSMNYQR